MKRGRPRSRLSTKDRIQQIKAEIDEIMNRSITYDKLNETFEDENEILRELYERYN